MAEGWRGRVAACDAWNRGLRSSLRGTHLGVELGLVDIVGTERRKEGLLMPLALSPERLGRRPSRSPTSSSRGGEEELIVQVLHDVSTFHS